jgi:hypothetical protein
MEVEVEVSVSGSRLLVWASALCTCKSRFRGAFEMLRKTTTAFTFPVRPSVRMEQLASRWTDFRETLCLELLLKPVENIQVWLKADRTRRHCTCRLQYVYDDISINSFR